MPEMDAPAERYCPRVDDWKVTWRTAWGGVVNADEHHCAECGAAVIYNPRPDDGQVRLVCITCLTHS